VILRLTLAIKIHKEIGKLFIEGLFKHRSKKPFFYKTVNNTTMKKVARLLQVVFPLFLMFTFAPHANGQISQVLRQDSNISLQIVGHTDSDGNDDHNLGLSKNRTQAVKNTLVNVYNIDEARLSFDGKGESEPVGNNTTLDGKAQNRRVEFIKI